MSVCCWGVERGSVAVVDFGVVGCDGSGWGCGVLAPHQQLRDARYADSHPASLPMILFRLLLVRRSAADTYLTPQHLMVTQVYMICKEALMDAPSCPGALDVLSEFYLHQVTLCHSAVCTSSQAVCLIGTGMSSDVQSRSWCMLHLMAPHLCTLNGRQASSGTNSTMIWARF